MTGFYQQHVGKHDAEAWLRAGILRLVVLEHSLESSRYAAVCEDVRFLCGRERGHAERDHGDCRASGISCCSTILAETLSETILGTLDPVKPPDD